MFTRPGRWIKARPHGFFKFYCTPCKDYYLDALSKPLKGIDRPGGASDDWKPSILDHIKHGHVALSFEERNRRPIERKPDQSFMERYWRNYEKRREFTPAQIACFRALQKHQKQSRSLVQESNRG